MKIRYLLFFAVLWAAILSSCRDGYEPYDGLYVSWTMGKSPLYNMTIDNQFPKTLDLTIASSVPVDRDIRIQLQTDPSLVEAFNRKYYTNYVPVPEGAFLLTDPVAVIGKGNFSTTEPVRFNILSTKGFEPGNNYMMPVTIVEADNGYRVIESSRTIYIALTQVIVRPALDLGTRGYVGTKFSKAPLREHGYDVRKVTKLTLEGRFFMRAYNAKSFNSLMGLEENFVIRASTYNNGGGRLEVAGGGMTFISNNQPFPLNEWVHMAVVYDGDDSGAGKVSVYLNGELQVSTEVKRSEKRKYIDLCGRYTGGGWNDDDYFMIGQSVGARYLNGAVSEARVWVKALTASEIRGNICAVDPLSEGLLGYWLFDEKDGYTFKDATGHGYDMTSQSGRLGYVEEVRCPEN